MPDLEGMGLSIYSGSQNSRLPIQCTGGENMNKTELIAAVAERAELSKKDAEAAVTAALDAVAAALAEGDEVRLVGFGTFEVKHRKARMGRNPKDPEKKIEIPASKVPAFKPGKALKDVIAQS